MSYAIETLLVIIVLADFWLLAASRMRAVIKAAALQGILLGAIPLLAHGGLDLRLLLVCAGAIALKGLVIPLLLLRALRDAAAQREVEPIGGYTASLLLGAAGTALAVVFSSSLPLAGAHQSGIAVPASLSTVFAGFLILVTRRQAIHQVVGYLALENGIYIFGLLLIEALPLLVELGVLLDLFVGVFTMGIILHRIQRSFSTPELQSLEALKE